MKSYIVTEKGMDLLTGLAAKGIKALSLCVGFGAAADSE